MCHLSVNCADKLQAETDLLSNKIPKLEEINKNCIEITEKALLKSEKCNEEKIELQEKFNQFIKGGSSEMVISKAVKTTSVVTKDTKVAEISKDLQDFQSLVQETVRIEKMEMRKFMDEMTTYANKLDFQKSQKNGESCNDAFGIERIRDMICKIERGKKVDFGDARHNREGHNLDRGNAIEFGVGRHNNARHDGSLQITVEGIAKEKDELKEQLKQTASLLNASKERERKLKRRIKNLEKLLEVNSISSREENFLRDIKTLQKRIFRLMSTMAEPLPEMKMLQELNSNDGIKVGGRGKKIGCKKSEGVAVDSGDSNRQNVRKVDKSEYRDGEKGRVGAEPRPKRLRDRAFTIDHDKDAQQTNHKQMKDKKGCEKEKTKNEKDGQKDGMVMQTAEQRYHANVGVKISNDCTMSEDGDSIADKSDTDDSSTKNMRLNRREIDSSDEGIVEKNGNDFVINTVFYTSKYLLAK